MIIIGNKIDLDNNREISFEEAKNKFKDKNIPLIETSALNDTNVNEAFESMVKILYLEYKKDGGKNTNLLSEQKGEKGINLNENKNNEHDENKKSILCCFWW